MGLKEQISADMKEAMKARQMERLNALRLVQAAFKNREIELRPNLIGEEELVAVLKRLVKQRKESIEQYQQAKRADLADAEARELALLETYLPAQMGREQVEQIVAKAIADLGASSAKQMGQVMKEVIARTGGTADNKLVSELVKAKLQPQ
jgi:uncharacterized protein YqeY